MDVLRHNASGGAGDVVAGTSTTYTGGGTEGAPYGNGGPASDATLFGGNTLSVDSSGALYLGDGGTGSIRRIDPISEIIDTFIPADATCATPLTFYGCGGGDSCYLAWGGAALYVSGYLCGSDVTTGFNRTWGIIRRDGDGTIVRVAGKAGGLNNGTALEQTFARPQFLALDPGNGLYVAAFQDSELRFVSFGDGMISVISGTTTPGDCLPLAQWRPDSPVGMVRTADGHVVFVENTNYVTVTW